jgi:hypothetical protein
VAHPSSLSPSRTDLIVGPAIFRARKEFTVTSPDPNDWETHRQNQIVEYGTYVASSPIDVGGVRAYNVGDPVPISNVEEHGYLDQGLVEKVADPPKLPRSASKSATPAADKSSSDKSATPGK